MLFLLDSIRDTGDEGSVGLVVASLGKRWMFRLRRRIWSMKILEV